MARPLALGRAQRRVGVLRHPHQRRRPPVAPDLPRLRVPGEPHPDRDGLEQGLQLRRARAQRLRRLAPDPRHRDVGADARQQLARGERLGQVVVGPGVQPLDPRLLAGAGGEQDHRQVAERRVGAQRAQQAEAVEARHHHVGEHQVGRRCAGAPPSAACAVGDRLDRVASVAEQAARRSRACRRCRRRAAPGAPAARPAGGEVVRRRASAQRRPASASPVAAGSQRSASSTKARRARAGRRCAGARRADALGRQVRASRTGRRTVKRVPRPSSLSAPTDAAVQPDQLLHQRQPDAAALAWCGPCAPSTRWKRSNSRGSSSAGMPVPVSRDRELGAGAARRAALTAISPVERELERVGEQVEDDLLPHVAVDVDRLGQRRAVDDVSVRPARSHGRAEVARQLGGERGEVGRLVAAPAPAPPRCGRSRAAC